MLLIIDFLILNFKGSLTRKKDSLGVTNEIDTTPFHMVQHQYGNKTFKDVYDLFYVNERVGTLNANPRSNIIAADLIQFQFENHLFYTNTLNDLNQLVFNFVDYFAVTFEGINRLDIACDKKENRLKYLELYMDLLAGKKLLKGREKNIAAHSVTKQGQGKFNGFTVGKRSSARFLRIYNKSEALRSLKDPKPYITEYHEKNNLVASPGLDVWRFEYQLNSTFFTYLRKYGKNITFQVFEMETLIDLIRTAEKNHFEIVCNTGKSETNKEKSAITLNDWSELYNQLVGYSASVVKLSKVFEPSIVIQKRLIKSLFRQYYIEQNLAYLYPMCKIIGEYGLRDWFIDKYDFYMREFMNKEKIRARFNEQYFIDIFDKILT